MRPSQQLKPTPSSKSATSPPSADSHELRFEAIGTAWQIDTVAPLSSAVRDAIRELIERFDSTWSRFRDDSLVCRIAAGADAGAGAGTGVGTGAGAGRWYFPPEAPALFALYRTLYEATDGAVTPLVGRALENLGYDRAYSLRPSGPAEPVPAWEDALHWDGRALTTFTPSLIDVGAAGKGYLVDLVATVLTEAGIAEFVIDASGDIVQVGASPIRVALEHPRDPKKAIGVLELHNGALCASSTSRRAWGDGLHHIIDPVTGLPTTEVIATWVRAADGLTADGLATALFFVGGPRLSGYFTFTYARMFSDGRVEHSPDFDGELFL